MPPPHLCLTPVSRPVLPSLINHFSMTPLSDGLMTQIISRSIIAGNYTTQSKQGLGYREGKSETPWHTFARAFRANGLQFTIGQACHSIECSKERAHLLGSHSREKLFIIGVNRQQKSSSSRIKQLALGRFKIANKSHVRVSLAEGPSQATILLRCSSKYYLG